MNESFPQFLSRFEWIIFDADNTLYDYNSAESFALFKTFKDMSIKLPYQNEKILKAYQSINSKLWKKLESGEVKNQNQLKLIRTKVLFDFLNVESDIKLFAETYLENLGLNDDLIEHAHSVVQTLAKTHSLVLMTNGMSKVQRSRFKNSSIIKYFNQIIVSEEVGVSKPSKEIFGLAFDAMANPNKDKVLMIGDSLSSDIQGAINFGLQSIWFNPRRIKTKHFATHELDDLIDLIL